EACRHADAVITMLSDDAAVEDVVLREDGIPAGANHIGCSTISTALARRLAQRGSYISAPVFGRPETAEARKLLVVPAGAPDLVERFRPVFDAMGQQTFVAG